MDYVQKLHIPTYSVFVPRGTDWNWGLLHQLSLILKVRLGREEKSEIDQAGGGNVQCG